MKRFSVIILFLILLSCKKEFDDASCQKLIFKRAKGLNAAAGTRANDFEKYCKNKRVKITYKQCENATNYLLTSFKKVTSKKMKSKFGQEILNCFNKSMLKKHLEQ